MLLGAAAESPSSPAEIPWCFSQVKGTIEEEVTEGQSVCVSLCVLEEVSVL